jgi:hypothetical protein
MDVEHRLCHWTHRVSFSTSASMPSTSWSGLACPTANPAPHMFTLKRSSLRTTDPRSPTRRPTEASPACSGTSPSLDLTSPTSSSRCVYICTPRGSPTSPPSSGSCATSTAPSTTDSYSERELGLHLVPN